MAATDYPLVLGALGAALLAAPPPARADLVPVGPGFVVEDFTTTYPSGPAVAPDGAGGFVVVWEKAATSGADTDDDSIRGRRYDRAAMPVGGEFVVNTYTTSFQRDPAIATDAAGRSVVVWTSDGSAGSDDDGTSVHGRLFDAAGTPVGDDFQVNTYTTGAQGAPRVAADAAGSFVVVWASDAQDGSDSAIMGRRFDGDGAPLGSEFQVNTYTTDRQYGPAVAAEVAGGFVVVWSSAGRDGDYAGVAGRRFDAAGAPLAPEFLVNTYTTSFQNAAAVAADPNGGFVVAWQSADSGGYGGYADIRGRRYRSDGSPDGDDVQLFDADFSSVRPALATDASGGFLVVWRQGPASGPPFSEAQRFSRDATPIGNLVSLGDPMDFQVQEPAVAAQGPDGFVVAWYSVDLDNNLGIFGQRYADAGAPRSGKKLVIKTPPGRAARNKVVFLSKDAATAVPASAGEDPRCAPDGSGGAALGGLLRVTGTGGDVAIPLPCAGWAANAAGTRYKYTDSTGATCKVVLLVAGERAKAVCKGEQVAYALGAPQADVRVVVSTGELATARKACAEFGTATAAAVVKDGSDGKTFKALDAGVAPGCP